ncbi:hypothetical protein MMC22_005429 [Lobaria immixta]|nr:hypothetical protein [Lobaria immixta]
MLRAQDIEPVATIGAGQKAALAEAYVAIISMLPTSLGNEFMGIGGYSLMSLGSRKTEHIDFAVSANGLNAFEQAAKNDPRLHEGSIDEWYCISKGKGIENVNVPIAF